VSSRSPARLSDPSQTLVGERVRDERATHGPQLLDPLTTSVALRLHLTAEVLALQPGCDGRSACPAAILAGCFRNSHEHPVATDQGGGLAVTHSDITLQRTLGADALRLFPRRTRPMPQSRGCHQSRYCSVCNLPLVRQPQGSSQTRRRPAASDLARVSGVAVSSPLARTGGRNSRVSAMFLEHCGEASTPRPRAGTPSHTSAHEVQGRPSPCPQLVPA
jgi:hypothetical protein